MRHIACFLIFTGCTSAPVTHWTTIDGPQEIWWNPKPGASLEWHGGSDSGDWLRFERDATNSVELPTAEKR